MASVKTPLLRKLEKLLTKRFPAPASLKLEDHDGIIAGDARRFAQITLTPLRRAPGRPAMPPRRPAALFANSDHVALSRTIHPATIGRRRHPG